jgi:hypothetical protein
MSGMRTTLTVDDALLRALKDFAHKTGTPFKEVLDRALRAGMSELGRKSPPRPHRTRTYDMGTPTGVNLDKARQLADALEDDEILRKIALRK